MPSGADSPEDFVAKLQRPRAVWVMIPAGITGKIVDQFAALLDEGDIIIDGGNSNYRDDVRRAAKLKEQGIHYVDIGTSGGVFGLERGYCLMVGGPDEAVAQHRPGAARPSPPVPARSSAPPAAPASSAAEELGYLHCGPSGAGHFVKMVHNGIEYGIMAAFAEGLNILDNADAGIREAEHSAEIAPLEEPEYYQFDIDTAKVVGAVAPRLGRLLLAAGSHRGRAAGQPDAGRARRPRLGLRRGPLDGQGGRRHRRTGPGAGRVAVRAVRVPRRGPLRQPGAVGDAPAVRWPPGAAGR